MTSKESLLSQIETMSESEIEKILPFIELVRSGVIIHRVYHGRPVVKEAELSKLDLDALFNDDFKRLRP